MRRQAPDVWDWLLDRTVTRPAYEAFRALRAAELTCDGRDRLEILVR